MDLRRVNTEQIWPLAGYAIPIMRLIWTKTFQIGDVITIHAKNFASRNYSLHPHGVQYLKQSEGALYADGTPNSDKFIMPNASKTYTWNMFAE